MPHKMHNSHDKTAQGHRQAINTSASLHYRGSNARPVRVTVYWAHSSSEGPLSYDKVHSQLMKLDASIRLEPSILYHHYHAKFNRAAN